MHWCSSKRILHLEMVMMGEKKKISRRISTTWGFSHYWCSCCIGNTKIDQRFTNENWQPTRWHQVQIKSCNDHHLAEYWNVIGTTHYFTHSRSAVLTVMDDSTPLSIHQHRYIHLSRLNICDRKKSNSLEMIIISFFPSLSTMLILCWTKARKMI
jgi:hypothetical protein